MTYLPTQLSSPRLPLQQRGQARFELVLEAARALLLEQGMDGFSIPALAERLGFTRASIYNFFPSPYAVLNELTRRELEALEQRLVRRTAETPEMGWRDRVRFTVETAAQFYEERPIARLLVLGSSLTDEGYRAHALTVQHLGGMSQRMFEAAGTRLPTAPIPVMALAVELATACLRQSVLLHGQVTPDYCQEAVRVMIGYLEPYVRAAWGKGPPVAATPATRSRQR